VIPDLMAPRIDSHRNTPSATSPAAVVWSAAKFSLRIPYRPCDHSRLMAPRAALAAPLVPGVVSVTLTEEDDGWVFVAWSRYDCAPMLPPSEQDRLRRFPTADVALAFFRERYAKDFGTAE
jgi:hypothetical protein